MPCKVFCIYWHLPRYDTSTVSHVLALTPSTGKYIEVVWDEVNADPRMIYPVTAYEVPEPS